MTTSSRATSATSEDIAVVGLACLFPGAPDVATFWRNILAKVDAITDPPLEAWDPSHSLDPAGEDSDSIYCRKGGYLGPLAYFDPLAHGIMPRAVEGGEPDQWLALRVAREALRDAGYDDRVPDRERAALILGKGTYANRGTLSVVQHAMMVDYTLQILKSVQPGLTDRDLQLIRADLKRNLPRFDAETAPALIPNVTVGRIANRLDIMGPSYTVDAACASSLVAIDIAVKGLRDHEYDVAIVGGLQVATPLPVLGLFCRLNALSPSGRIRPFDQEADGTLLSEGLGMAVLKRRSQAEHDGDRIYALVKGTGVASDGRAISVLAPRVDGEELALRRAYERAHVPPHSVGLIEAHGTGTLVGDAVEVDALKRVFGERTDSARCALGSVKSMIGHTMPAAGIAGFIKSALALYYKVLPPTLNVAAPSPRLGLDRTPFYINTETRPWIHGNPAYPRRAGVNAFGFGGINAHVVLEEHPADAARTTHDLAWDSEVCLFAADSRQDLIRLGRDVAAAITRDPSPTIAAIARALNLRPAAGPVVLGIVADSAADLARKLERALSRLADPACRRIREIGGIYFFDEPLAAAGKVAFVFPGEGAQYVGMLGDLCRHFPAVRACFDEVDRILTSHPRGYVLSEFLFPPPGFSPEDRAAAERRLWQMDIAVEAVLTANHALHALLMRLGIAPDALLGHSTGEFSALRAAGMMDEEHEQRILEMNALYQQATSTDRLPVRADLIAIGAPRDRVAALCAPFGPGVCVAMDNCPHQLVVAAAGNRSRDVQEACRAEGLLYEVLSFDRPYHTPMFEPFADGMRQFFDRWITRPPATPLYSCATTTRYPAGLEEIRQVAYEHWIRPVEFSRTIETMYADGVRVFLEAGPRGNLTAFIDDILGRRPHAAIAVNVARRSGITQLNHALAQLGAHGVALQLAPLYERRALEPFDWTAGQVQPSRSSKLGRVKIPTGASEMRLSPEIIERIRQSTRSVPAAAAPPAPAVQHVPADVRPDAPAAPAPLPDVSGRHDVVAAFLGTMDTFLSVGHDYVRAMLGGTQVALDAAPSTTAPPFIDTIVSSRPGGPLVARCTIDLDRYPFLRDHTLGRRVSDDDPALPGFPIVPFTVLTEVMAEAAALLAPGRVLIGMADVRVNRWLAVDEGALTLEIHAHRLDDTRIHVTILDADAAAAAAGTVAEGVMEHGDRYPEPPSPEPLALPDGAPFKWPSDRLYEAAMFHGPAFRGVQSVDRVGRAGAAATLTAIDAQGLPHAGGAGGFVTDFVLLDQPGQVVGFWAAQCLDRAFFVLPVRMRSLRLYGPVPAGQRVTCTARVAMHGDHELSSTLDVIRPDGRPWARLEGWDDHRFDLPASAHQMLVQPQAARLSRPWRMPERTDGDAVAFRVGLDSFPPGWLNAHGGLWRRVIASLVLSRRERALWQASQMPEARRLEWLLGRIAAKDAVREYLLRRHSLSLRPADVEILPDASGRPVAGGAWTARIAQPPLVSISHAAAAAIAIAGDAEELSGIGIDLERHGRMTSAMEPIAFSDGERRLLNAFQGEERQAWSLRLWCAKEATAKAGGCAVGPAARAMNVEHIDPVRGTVRLRQSLPGRHDAVVSVQTAVDGAWVIATCHVDHEPSSAQEELPDEAYARPDTQ